MLYSGNKLNKITEILNNNSDNSKSGWWTTFGKYIGGNWLGSVVSWVVPALDKLGVFSKWGDSIIKWAPFTEGAYVKNTVTFIMLYSSLRDTLWNSLDMKETVIPNQSYSAFDRFIVPFVAALRCYYTISDNKEQRGELLQQFKDGAKSVGDGISRAVNTVGDGIKSVKDKTQQLFNGSDGVEIQTNLPYRRRVS